MLEQDKIQREKELQLRQLSEREEQLRLAAIQEKLALEEQLKRQIQ